MPAYVKSPFKQSPQSVVAGQPTYLLGSWNDRTGDTIGAILQSLAIGTTGELLFLIKSGNAPIVGALITVEGSGRSANLNVTNAVITAVSTDFATGICTVAYAIASTTLPLATDSGFVSIPQPEVPEALVNGASVPCAVPFQNARTDGSRSITAAASFPSLPTTVVVALQEAINDLDAEYSDIATVNNVVAGVAVGGEVSVETVSGRFYRFNVTGLVGGTLPTIIAKLVA